MRESNPSRRVPREVSDLADAQDDVLTRGQLAAAGFDDERVATRTRSGLWVASGPRL